MPADSFYDAREFNEVLTRDHSLQESENPSCLDDLSTREKVEYFVKGMKDNAIDLMKFRAAAQTSADVRAFKSEIWDAMNGLAWVLSSILAEEQAEETKALYEKKRAKSPTIIHLV